MHSATKYLNGHSDMIGGVVVTNRNDISEKLAFLQNSIGAIIVVRFYLHYLLMNIEVDCFILLIVFNLDFLS